MRIAAIADLHCRATSAEEIRSLLANVEDEADLLVMAGDLTNRGRIEEMEVLIRELGRFSLPKVAVLGNHDHESDHPDEMVRMLEESGVHVLDGCACEIDGVGFVGSKGFCGGFDNLAVQPFGEKTLKMFIQSSIEEAARLENALPRLGCRKRVGVLHYSPIKATLKGEQPELFPFLGSSLLGEALDRHGVDLIVHGHAHVGFPEGHTAKGTPVHNVCHFVRTRYNMRPYIVMNV